MNRRKCFIISISILFLLALINTPTINAATYERGWNIGTVLEYTKKSVERRSLEATNATNYWIYESEVQYLISVNITEIDDLNKIVTIVETLVGSSPDEYVLDFDSNNVSNELVEDFYYFHFYWDYNFNRAILTAFGVHFSFINYILEPDWTTFNENLVQVLDENQTIAAIDTGYEIQYIFLSDFLEKISLNINGKDNLAEAKNSFTSDTTRWVFEFEVSGYILDPEYDFDEDIYEYFEYENYVVKLELEYTKDGILSELLRRRSTSIIKDNIKYTFEAESSYVSGDTGTASINYSLASAIIVLIFLPVLLQFKRNKNS